MMSAVTWLLFAIIVLNAVHTSMADPCQSAIQLSDESRAVFTVSSYRPHDSGGGWYRFMGRAGNSMLHYDPRGNDGRCSSAAQGYLATQPPTGYYYPIPGKVCFRHGNNHCRWYSYNVQVKNCGAYFVYNLPSTYSVNQFSYTKMRYCGSGELVDTTSNPCQSPAIISDSSRSVLSTAGTYTHDQSINGWYRFSGNAGTQMIDYEPLWQSGVYRCKALALGWLSGKHPSTSEGKVSRTVCFSYNGNKCWLPTTIKVKNCGHFYVYWLKGRYRLPESRYMRYCGAGDTVDTVQSPCQSYNALSDESRSVLKVDSTYKNDEGTNGWYRFVEKAGSQMLDYETIWQNGVYRCKAKALGWLTGKHPTVGDGKVYRTVCFSNNGNKCWYSTKIKIQNCDGFYVYWLRAFSSSQYMRYCGFGDAADTVQNPCQNYSTVSDASRSVLKVNGTYTNDLTINGWYRFMDKAGSQILDYETIWQNGVYRCKAIALGWLNGKHPELSDGKVNRTVCFKYKGDRCWYSMTIKMQSCDGFFVYLLKGLYSSHYMRYCGMGDAPDITENPCIEHKLLTDASRSVLVNNETYTNDQYLSGWYRFMNKAGNKILDYDPQWQSGLYRCKAMASGWVKGKHPRGYQGKANRTMCFSYNGDNCWYSTRIQIRFCGDFYVYWLKGLYSKHYMTYCGAGETKNNYPCKYYQLLTEKSRSEQYRTSKNEYCDKYMAGWYRFWGAAGHRMLDHCPVTGQMLFICGAYNQGWLNETNPVPLDGTVNRTMCFSDFTDNACKCNPKLETQIQMRHCGDYIVYNLKSIDKCSRKNNARYCGMKDKDAHNVTCSANYMQIDLDRRYYNSSTYKSIRLRSPKCGHTLSYDYITLGSIPSACDSIKQETKTEIVYINAVKLTAQFGKGLVSREHDETIYFKCIYRRDAFIENEASFTPVGEVKVELEKFGNFSFHINTYKKNSYAERIDEFPVKLKLRDWLYFEVNATVKDSSLSLLIEQCYSTPNMDPEQPLKYYLIEDRCAVDITTQFIPATGLRRRFSMQAFRYENSTSVYIHCLVFLCRKTSTDERCSTGCFGNKIRRKRRDIASESLTDAGSSSHTGYYKLDSGQIIFDESDDSKSVRPEKGGSDKTTPTTTILFGVMGVVAAVLAAVVVMLLLRRKHPPEAKVSFKKEIGIVNAVEVT